MLANTTALAYYNEMMEESFRATDYIEDLHNTHEEYKDAALDRFDKIPKFGGNHLSSKSRDKLLQVKYNHNT